MAANLWCDCKSCFVEKTPTQEFNFYKNFIVLWVTSLESKKSHSDTFQRQKQRADTRVTVVQSTAVFMIYANSGQKEVYSLR